MYKIKDLDPRKLDQAKVKNQNKILQVLQFKFSPIKGFEILKRDTKDFSVMDEEAVEADKLFVEFLNREGIDLPAPEVVKKDPVKIRERERTRRLRLLALKLKLTPKKE